MQKTYYRSTVRIVCYLLLSFSMISLIACTQNNQSAKPERYVSSEQAVMNKIEALLEFPVTLEIDTRNVIEPWIFLTGIPLTSDGNRIDYSKTQFAEDVKEGYFDDNFIALLHSADDDSGYTLVAFSLGATDAPFVDWPEIHEAPRELIFSE